MRYAVVIEFSGRNYAAYAPDLPGCVATGVSIAVVEDVIRQAIITHVGAMRDQGLAIPAPTSQVLYVDATA